MSIITMAATTSANDHRSAYGAALPQLGGSASSLPFHDSSAGTHDVLGLATLAR